MNEHLKRFRVTVKTAAPLHIGSGEKIGKKEYILAGNRVYCPDVAKMYRYLSDNDKAVEFEQFMLVDVKNDLKTWLTKNDIRPGEWNWGGYRLFLPATKQDKDERDIRFNELHTFIKDPYGLPYIPGSSLKGALRNIIMTEKILRDKQGGKLEELKSDLLRLSDNDLRRNAREIKKIYDAIVRHTLYKLNRDEKNPNKVANDVMAAVRISDSKPLRLADLTICEKIDRHISLEKGDRPLPTFRECLKPGVSASFTMTVDTDMLRGDKDAGTGFEDFFDKILEFKAVKFRGTKLQNAIRRFNVIYDEGFREKFECDLDGENVIFLCGGSGFLTKTVLLGLLRDDDDRLRFISSYMVRNFSRHKHEADRALGVSPHTMKMTEYAGAYYEMGKCTIDIVELKG
jgi:CRISPR-associated protein Csm5